MIGYRGWAGLNGIIACSKQIVEYSNAIIASAQGMLFLTGKTLHIGLLRRQHLCKMDAIQRCQTGVLNEGISSLLQLFL